MSKTSHSAYSDAIYRLFLAAPALFSGTTHALEVLRKDDLLTKVYDTADNLDYEEVIRLFGNTNPHLRVLEVGAGTGGTTAKILAALKSSYGESLLRKYTFTDISSGFMAAAKARFSQYQNIEYAVLHISKDPLEQGFALGDFDLIIATNVSTLQLYLSPVLLS